jgi:hypothetical protein
MFSITYKDTPIFSETYQVSFINGVYFILSPFLGGIWENETFKTGGGQNRHFLKTCVK